MLACGQSSKRSTEYWLCVVLALCCLAKKSIQNVGTCPQEWLQNHLFEKEYIFRIAFVSPSAIQTFTAMNPVHSLQLPGVEVELNRGMVGVGGAH